MKTRKWLMLVTTVVLLLGVAVQVRAEDCNPHPGLQALDDPTYGPYCGGSGSGCTECISWDPAPGISFSDCYRDSGTGDVYCFTYGTGGIENQR